MPLLRANGDRSAHRDLVRSEYYHTLSPRAPGREGWEGSYATMVRDRRYKLVTYHGHEHGELFDLETDPAEFDNRWHDPELAGVRFALMQRSFDALAFAVDIGPEQNHAF